MIWVTATSTVTADSTVRAAVSAATVQVMPMRAMAETPTATPDRATQVKQKLYPNYKIIVLNDDFNTFQHVSECLMKYVPGMSSDRAWELTNQIHFEGQAIVWIGPQEQAELYHEQLGRAGLTMAPLEAA